MIRLFRRLFAWLRGPAPATPTSLHVNASTAGTLHERERVNLYCAVNNADIYEEVDEAGDTIIVIPSYTLPDGVVMNGGYYPADEIAKSYASLEGTLAPLGHPVVNGEYVSANDPQAIHRFHAGAWNAKVERQPYKGGHRVYVEKRLNKRYAEQTEKGRELLDALNKKEPIHTSTGIFLQREEVRNADGYSWIARNMQFDHDAILLNETGAATPGQGVGLMVNVASATPVGVTVNAGLDPLQGSGRAQLLDQAVQAKWGGENSYPWLAGWDETTAIVQMDGGVAEQWSYSIVDGAVKWGEGGQAVQRKETWVDKAPIVNRFLQLMGFGVNSPVQPADDPAKPKEDATDMDRAELDAALAANQTATLNAVKELLQPLTQGLGELKANHDALSETLTANARAAEAEKRSKVEAVIGKTAADALTGNALDEAFAKLSGAAPIVPGFQPNGDNEVSFVQPSKE